MAHVFAPTSSRTRGSLVLALVGVVMLYLVGLDQGQLLSVIQGQTAFDQNLIHELVHDARHAAGFPCH
jgi:hypothetical protein